MANTKISALTAASSLVDADVLGGAQGATNKKFTLADLKDYCRTRADVMIDSSINLATRNSGLSNHIVRTAAGTYYYFWISADNSDVYWSKTTNYGVTWLTPQSIKVTVGLGLAVWFDKWTPGDAGTVIHLAYYESTGHDVFYRALDTASDTLGSEITVFAGASAVGGANSCISITKSKAGRILVGFDIDGGTEVGFYKSDDFPVTAFTVKTDLNEAASTDYYMLFPGNDADTADVWALFWDRSADEISLKVFDDSGNSWSETSIAASMVESASTIGGPFFAGAVRNSDGHLIVAAWSAGDTLNADLRVWDINGAASITEKTNAVANSVDDQGCVAVAIDSDDDTIYAFYLGKSDGSETAYTSLNVYYKTSADGGTTWGAETQLSTSARICSYVLASLEFAAGDFAVVYGGAEVASLTARVSALT